MFIFSAIYGMFKSLLLNFRRRENTYTSEVTKIVFATVAGIWLLNLLIAFNEVPVRKYELSVQKLFNNSPQDSFCLSINIGYDGKSSKALFPEYKKGVKLHIVPVKDTTIDSMKSTENLYMFPNMVENFEFCPRDRNIRKIISFIDSVKASYIIRSSEAIYPNNLSFIKDIIRDTLAFDFKVKTKKDSIIHPKQFEIRKKKVIYDKGIKTLEAVCLVGITNIDMMHQINVESSKELTGYRFFSDYDISQSNYFIRFMLPNSLPKGGNALSVEFNGATEFSEMYPKPDRTTLTSIFYDDPDKLKQIGGNGLYFNARHRELESLQMVRLFFITTILGFLLGLFFSSIWNLLILCAESFRKKLNN